MAELEFQHEPRRALGKCTEHRLVVLGERKPYEDPMNEGADDEDDWY